MNRLDAVSRISITAVLALSTSQVSAQTAAPTTPQVEDAGDDIVVTGSYISGSKNEALPVAIVTSDELQRRGNPTLLELVKQLPASGGVIGETNQTGGTLTAASGVATINLRNLGAQRTLVLLNGQRIAPFPVANGPVNINNLPQMAIGRIDMLKDGAAATYGSDAVAGVVNFITRKDVNGLEVTGSARHVRSASQPDFELGGIWGWKGDRGNVMVAGGYQERGQLRGNERGWSTPTYLENPDAGFGASANPSRFTPVNGTTRLATVRDPGCGALGSTPGYLGGVESCITSIVPFFNIVDPTERWQIYAEANFDLTDDVTFHVEALRASTHARVNSVANSTINGNPTSNVTPFPGSYFVPASNPGLIALRQQFPNAIPGAATGVLFSANEFRPFGLGGTGLNKDGVNYTDEDSDNYHVSAGFRGELSGVKFALNATYDTTKYERNTVDTMIYRNALALRGFGNLADAPNACNAANTNNFTTGAGNAALGCHYFNPFSNAVPTNILTGEANSAYNAAVANPTGLVNWMQQPIRQSNYSELFTTDLTLNGELPLQLWGGPIGWAVGAQYRHITFRTDFNNLFDINAVPCTDTLLTGSRTCAAPSGPFALFANSNPVNVNDRVLAAYAELSIPITDRIETHIAARFEDYGLTGSTFNPKFDARWKVLDWFSLRGSVGTTFRAPPLNYLDPTAQTRGGTLRGAVFSVATVGNPNLGPEKATTYNLGAVISTSRLQASVDFWNYKLKDPFTAQPFGTIVSTFFPSSDANCGNPALADLQSLLTFVNNVCGLANLQKVTVSFINGAGQKTNGLDFIVDYRMPLLDGELTIGGDATWTLNYDVEDQRVFGTLVTPAFDAVGKLNSGTGLYSLPEWRANGHIEYSTGPHNIRFDLRYIDGYLDQRSALFTGTLVTGSTPGTAVTTPRPTTGRNIKSFTTLDMTYRLKVSDAITVVANVSNIFDRDPPLVHELISYDSFVANPLGRTYRLSATVKY